MSRCPICRDQVSDTERVEHMRERHWSQPAHLRRHLENLEEGAEYALRDAVAWRQAHAEATS